MTEKVRLRIQEMSCASPVGRVERALREVPGVAEASMNLATDETHVVIDPAQTGVSALAAGVKDAGYDTGLEKTTFAIAGMRCAFCVARVEKAVLRLPGVVDVSVNPATNKASVAYLPSLLDPARIIDAVACGLIGHR